MLIPKGATYCSHKPRRALSLRLTWLLYGLRRSEGNTHWAKHEKLFDVLRVSVSIVATYETTEGVSSQIEVLHVSHSDPPFFQKVYEEVLALFSSESSEGRSATCSHANNVNQYHVELLS